MRKLCLLGFILLSMTSVQAAETPICENEDTASKITNAVCVFNRPLLVGASLTRGEGANPGGPSIIIAESLSPGAKANAVNISQSGTTSLSSLKEHLKTKDDKSTLIPPSVVIGIDLFFWDAAKNECGDDFKKSARDFIQMYRDKNIPMILGKLPKGVSFPPGYSVLNTNDCANEVNTLLEEECKVETNCIIYDPKDCLSKISPEQREKFFVDKHHTSVAGNNFFAQEFIAAKKYEDLKCKND